MTVDNNHAERRRVIEGLAELGLEVTPSQSNFVMFRCPDGSDAESMMASLVALGVMVRPAFYLPKHIRVTVGTPADNSRFLAAVKTILEA
jgi:histidinol-phosphate aminotransferase